MNALKDLAARGVNVIHRTLVSATGGKVGSKIAGMPVVLLTTTGRRSGKPRHTVLASPLHDGNRVILVASYGGDARHPAWFLNLRDHPDVEITMHGRPRRMRARVAGEAERADLWPQIVEKYRGYGQYQTRTDRQIPVVILEAAR